MKCQICEEVRVLHPIGVVGTYGYQQICDDCDEEKQIEELADRREYYVRDNEY